MFLINSGLESFSAWMQSFDLSSALSMERKLEAFKTRINSYPAFVRSCQFTVCILIASKANKQEKLQLRGKKTRYLTLLPCYTKQRIPLLHCPDTFHLMWGCFVVPGRLFFAMLLLKDISYSNDNWQQTFSGSEQLNETWDFNEL